MKQVFITVEMRVEDNANPADLVETVTAGLDALSYEADDRLAGVTEYGASLNRVEED